MSALTVHAPRGLAATAPGLRFGSAAGAGEGSVQWLLKRNCSITPRHLLGFYASLCGVSLTIAALLWSRGAPFVLPFTGAELLAVGFAFLLFARHATDRESLLLQPGKLTVACTIGRHTEQVDFAPAWVRVEPRYGDRSLIELSGEGRRIAIGRFVRPELRRDLADELRAALRRCVAARHPPDH
jgi:uncharacterized membrane protein